MEMYEKEQNYFRDMVAKIKATGANVAFCQWGKSSMGDSYV